MMRHILLPIALVACGCSKDETTPRPTSIDSGKSADGPADGAGDANADGSKTDAPGAMSLTAPWADGAAIPASYTCDGANGSPALSWGGAPAGTKSFAIVMRDTSLTTPSNYHWVLFDLAPSTTSIEASVPSAATLPSGARQTNWSFGAKTGYGGPCPPTGTHTYVITLYALNAMLGLGSTDAAAVDTAIQGAKIASVAVSGTYKRP